MIEMTYDVRSAGVKVSFLVEDGAISFHGAELEDRIEMPCGGEDQPSVPAVYPPTPRNLNLLSQLLSQMAVAKQKEDSTYRCDQCGREIYWDGKYWAHKDGVYRHTAIPRKKN